MSLNIIMTLNRAGWLVGWLTAFIKTYTTRHQPPATFMNIYKPLQPTAFTHLNQKKKKTKNNKCISAK